MRGSSSQARNLSSSSRCWSPSATSRRVGSARRTTLSGRTSPSQKRTVPAPYENRDRTISSIWSRTPSQSWRGVRKPRFDQDLPEAGSRLEGVARIAELLGCDRPGPQQTLSQAVDHLVRGREHDLPVVEVDGLRVLTRLEEEKARLGRGVEHLQQVGQSEGPDVPDQHQLAVPRQCGVSNLRHRARAGSCAHPRPGPGPTRALPSPSQARCSDVNCASVAKYAPTPPRSSPRFGPRDARGHYASDSSSTAGVPLRWTPRGRPPGTCPEARPGVPLFRSSWTRGSADSYEWGGTP